MDPIVDGRKTPDHGPLQLPKATSRYSVVTVTINVNTKTRDVNTNITRSKRKTKFFPYRNLFIKICCVFYMSCA